jgi:hypothetical protein
LIRGRLAVSTRLKLARSAAVSSNLDAPLSFT